MNNYHLPGGYHFYSEASIEDFQNIIESMFSNKRCDVNVMSFYYHSSRPVSATIYNPALERRYSSYLMFNETRKIFYLKKPIHIHTIKYNSHVQIQTRSKTYGDKFESVGKLVSDIMKKLNQKNAPSFFQVDPSRSEIGYVIDNFDDIQKQL